MKKILSILLCLCMLLSLVTFSASAQEATDTNDATSTETLEQFGFSLDTSSYDTNALKPVTLPFVK